MLKVCDFYSLKNFIHKFIINCDEIFIFRKQFTTSFAANNFLCYLFKLQEHLNLNKISLNKETGSITLHNLQYLNYNKYAFNAKNKEIVPFRLTPNITVNFP